ncbi:MAG: phosphate signaling complex protein PhoU [Oscillospiraceae bacterium]
MRGRFDEQLEVLHTRLIEMGALCESAIANAMKALLEGGDAYANRAIELERDIDQREKEIETLCLRLLLQQQPVAKDLRQISSALKMVTDLERIGDQAADIAEIAQLDNVTASDDTLTVKEMSTAAIRMVTDSIEAYVKQDLELAREVVEYDDVVDDAFNKAKAELAALLGQHPDRAEYVIDLLMICKYLERIADHATNVAEWVVFSITGEHEGDNRDKNISGRG